MTSPPGHHAWTALSLAGLLIGIKRGNQRIHNGLDQSPPDPGHQRRDPQDGIHSCARRQIARKNHKQHAE